MLAFKIIGSIITLQAAGILFGGLFYMTTPRHTKIHAFGDALIGWSFITFMPVAIGFVLMYIWFGDTCQ